MKLLINVAGFQLAWFACVIGAGRGEPWVGPVEGGITEDIDPEEGLSTLDINYTGWRNATGLNWQRLFGSTGVGLLGVSHSQASLDQRVRDITRSGLPFDTTPVDELIAASPFVFAEDSNEGEATIKYDCSVYAGAAGKL